MSCVQVNKRQFYFYRIDSIFSSRQLFSVPNELLGKSRTTPLLSDVPGSELPKRFCDFFSCKISNLRDDLDSCSCEPPIFVVYDGPMLSHFDPVTEKELCDPIVGSPTKSCMLDPISTSLMKQCLHDLVPLVTAIINVSLSTGTVPKQFKQAVIIPLLKKPELDTNDLTHILDHCRICHLFQRFLRII